MQTLLKIFCDNEFNYERRRINLFKLPALLINRNNKVFLYTYFFFYQSLVSNMVAWEIKASFINVNNLLRTYKYIY